MTEAWNSPSWSRAARQYAADRRHEPHRAAKPLFDTDYVLAELRCLSLRASTIQADIDAITLALKGGLISPAQAIELLDNEIKPAFDELPTAEDAA
jgi:hypothetical protein